MISRRTQHLVTRAHTIVYRLTRGRAGGRLAGMEQVLLTTTGRSTGRERTTPLSGFPLEGGALLLVASDGGKPQHPQWYRNLLVHPSVRVQRRGTHVRLRARTATPAERAHWWPRVVAAYGGYAQYQARTAREIPLVVCEPEDA